MTVTAHAGAFDTPDNSVESVERALAEGAEIIEMDVSFRPDGTPVVIHKARPRAAEGVLLADVFALVAQAPGVRMNLDLKSVKNLPAVDSLLREYGLFDRAFFTGVGKNWAPKVREQSNVPYYLNVDVSKRARKYPADAKKLASRIRDAGALGLNCHYGNVTGNVIETLRAEGLETSVWTVNDEAAARQILPLRPDNVTSRHPDMILRVMKELGIE